MITYEFVTPWMLRDADVEDINRLLPQLTSSFRPVDRAKALDVSGNSILLFARNEDGRVLGMCTLCILHIPTATVGFIEDVVVDESLRGQGVGRRLTELLIEKVRSERLVDRIELTSSPKRIAANALYVSLGFEPRETNNYVLRF